MNNKTDHAYKTIGEVSRLLNLKNKNNKSNATHTIRFWEKEFKQIKPKILSGNRRYYDQKNIDLLKKIKFLLKDQGMTISGVKKLLNSNQSNELDELANKSISADNLRLKINNITKIIKELKSK
tara:strand:- start:78 stop:449 length:372 start_codon:yes stop_codon:yes gene_type:complete